MSHIMRHGSNNFPSYYRLYKWPYFFVICTVSPFCIEISDLKPIKLPRDWSDGQECWLKTELVNCFFEEGVTIGSLMHYDCKDNHNCEGSFVKFQVCLKNCSSLALKKN